MTAMSTTAHQPANRMMELRRDGSQHSPARSERRSDEREPAQGVATLLGWFSIGLGLTEIVAPREFARFIGVRGDRTNRTIVRLVGLRELAAGVGILSRRRPVGWLWARVAGDAMDLALLGKALASPRNEKDRVSAATAAVVGITALDLYASVRQTRESDGTWAPSWFSGVLEVKKAITIGKPAEEIYRFWRDFQNLPRFMNHLESVAVTGERTSHWKAKAPAGSSVEWDAEIVEDRPNQLIAWRSKPGSDVDNSGTVRFLPAPGGRGTEVHVEMRYDPPGGPIGAIVAKLFGEEPNQQVYDDLRALKQLMETGEVVKSEAILHGERLWQYPAQPRDDGRGPNT
ncbi:MAG: cyclase/dehydrase [Planctomycetota bacterium]|nr:cyclase/dehydrase [Planctomycetota bacterium]